MCDMTHSYVWHDSFTCATWLLHLCDMTLIHMWILRWLWVRDIQMTHWLWDVLITHRVEFFSFFLWWGESDLSLRTLKYLGPTLTFFRAIYEPRPHIVFGFGSVIICTRVRECMRVCVCATKVDSDGDRNCQVRCGTWEELICSCCCSMDWTLLCLWWCRFIADMMMYRHHHIYNDVDSTWLHVFYLTLLYVWRMMIHLTLWYIWWFNNIVYMMMSNIIVYVIKSVAMWASLPIWNEREIHTYIHTDM